LVTIYQTTRHHIPANIKSSRNVIQDIWTSGRDTNREPPDCEGQLTIIWGLTVTHYELGKGLPMFLHWTDPFQVTGIIRLSAYCPSYRRPHMHGTRYTCCVVAAQHYAAVPLSRRDGPNASSLSAVSASALYATTRVYSATAHLYTNPYGPRLQFLDRMTRVTIVSHTALASGPHVTSFLQDSALL
jgi:hypothetical protein